MHSNAGCYSCNPYSSIADSACENEGCTNLICSRHSCQLVIEGVSVYICFECFGMSQHSIGFWTLSEQNMVNKFQDTFGVRQRSIPSVPTVDEKALRYSLMHEELEEYGLAAKNNNVTEVADALADLMYVLLGTACTWGIDLGPIFNEVHRSNMTKAFSDGLTHYREDGKVLKSPDYSPADVANILRSQGYAG